MSPTGVPSLEHGSVFPFLPSSAVLLNGEWAFQLLDAPDEPTSSNWCSMPVPSLWTMQGTRDLPQYTNIRMPFPEQPPQVPTHNPTGVYEREFDVPAAWLDDRVVLRVGGFESLLRVWVNGNLVGHATDGRLASDFDVTAHVRAGMNNLQLRVTKWSATTHIEDQDQWWHGGITRDIHVFRTPRTHLGQLHLTPSLDGDVGVLRVRGVINGAEGILRGGHSLLVSIPEIGSRFGVAVSDGQPGTDLTKEEIDLAIAWERSEYADSGTPPRVAGVVRRREPLMSGGFDETLHLPGVASWNAEEPKLYTVVVEHLADDEVLETFTARVGFRSVEVRGVQLLINGAPIKIHGVNRHDFHHRTGRVLTYADVRADLLELKRWNVNAIRTSHYPNDPALLELADELGFYVVEEANIESHAHMHSLCQDPRYLGEFVARVSRMVQRDVRHPSVILWSLGNESGYGPNHDAAAAWVRHFDPTRPLHYEGAIRGDWTKGHMASDVICPMYPSIAALVRHATSGQQDRPLIMCEYSHAMGNSNGGLRDYWAAIDAFPGLQGGFVWEMWEHGLDQAMPDGRTRAAYGGDFGEGVHDGNFCCDGLFSPRREARPAMHEFKAVASPLRLYHVQDDVFAVSNRQWFCDADGFDLRWEALHADGSLRTGFLQCPPTPPQESSEVRLPVSGLVLLTVRFLRRTATAWASAGAEVGWDQFDLAPAMNVECSRYGQPQGERLFVAAAMVEAASIALWRAPTDNDRVGGAAARWEAWGIHDLQVLSQDRRDEDGAIVIDQVVSTRAGIRFTHERRIHSEPDAVVVQERIHLPAELNDVARVGTVLTMPPVDEVSWFGRGPHETYPDRKLAPLGVWSAPACSLHTDYVRPQENGGRTDVRWMALGRADGAWIVENDHPCQMSVSRYSDTQLAHTAHASDLVAEDCSIVHIDARHRGLGTASCGPDVLDSYRVATGTITWGWRLSRVLVRRD